MLRKKAISVMVLSAILMALLPALSASAARIPLPPPAYGFYELVTGSGTLVVSAEGTASYPFPEAAVPASWALTIQESNGTILYHQMYGTHAVLHNLPHGTYKVTFQAGVHTYASHFSAAFQ
ncbi:hypothetical protein [Paenibacillus paeoniae]|uniref:Carboxypeptidase regulatory-like domain-containing protein n=1 Tax=Paenibacillus paeoniae TaxID=2292705 RepID=A0A371P0D9_9BACL|nr:hypothetical protein [Paenibacillus paeoniae]REK69407.1 hypothetical protein DX130_24950 [Paenibacillus paeoniae]